MISPISRFLSVVTQRSYILRFLNPSVLFYSTLFSVVCRYVFCFAGILGFATSNSLAAVVGIWTFEHGIANTVAAGTSSVLDYSGNGNHGTPLGSPTYVNSGSGLGSIAMGFSTAPNQKIFFEDSAPFRISKSITIEAVFRFDGSSPGNSFGHNMILFRGDDRGGLDPYSLNINSNTLYFVVNQDNIDYSVVSAPIVVGKWYRVAGVLDDATGRHSLYVDGIEVDVRFTTARPLEFLDPTRSPGIAIGGAQSSNFQFGFGGLIDEVRLYNSAVDYGSPVPEPISLLVWGMGGCATLAARRKQRSKSEIGVSPRVI